MKRTDRTKPLRSRTRTAGGKTRPQHAEKSLKQALDWQKAIFEGSRDAIFIAGADSKFISVNAAACALTGYSKAELLTMRIPDLHADVDRHAYQKYHARIMVGEEILSAAKILRKDGSRIATEFNNRRIVIDGVPYMHTTARDITERNRAEEALRASEEQYRRLVETAHDLIWSIDAEGKFTFLNSAAQELFGYSPAELIGRSFLEIGGPDNYPDSLETFSQFIAQTDKFGEVEAHVRHRDGRQFILSINSTVLRDSNGAAIGMTGTSRDITEIKRAEKERERLLEEVRAGRERLQNLAHQLVTAQESERRFVANELHDEIGQALTGLKIMLDTWGKLPAGVIASRLSEAQELAGKLVDQVHDLSLDLHPTMLDDLGLVPALLWCFKRYTSQTGVRVSFDQSGLDGRFAPEIETAAFRIVQEALTNVARHAGVREATVRVWATEGVLHIQIQDHGKGFRAKRDSTASASVGLAGMRERSLALGGEIVVESNPGIGTQVMVELPLAKQLERRASTRPA